MQEQGRRFCVDCRCVDVNVAGLHECHHPNAGAYRDVVTGRWPTAREMRSDLLSATAPKWTAQKCGERAAWFGLGVLIVAALAVLGVF